MRELASRGHDRHVATGPVALEAELPPNVHLYPLNGGRPRFMWELGRLYRRLARADRFDVAHQLNPVDVAGAAR